MTSEFKVGDRVIIRSVVRPGCPHPGLEGVVVHVDRYGCLVMFEAFAGVPGLATSFFAHESLRAVPGASGATGA